MSAPVTPDAPARDRLSTAAFVVGLVAAITGVVYFVSVPMGVVGLVLGVVALRRPGSVRRVALGGVLLSAIGLVVGLGLVAFLVLDDDGRNTTVDGIKSDTGDDQYPPQRDLEATDCATDIDALRAFGSVRNRTAEAVDYTLFAAWERDGHQIAQGEAKVKAVPPGGSAEWEVHVTIGEDAPEQAAAECRIIRIDRRSAD